MINSRLDVDLIGAIFPLVVSSFIMFYIHNSKIIQYKQYLYSLISTSTFTFALSSVNNAVELPWLTLIWVYAAFSIISQVTIKELFTKELSNKDIINSILIGYNYSTISIIITDICYLPLTNYMYIGGQGFVDAIFLSSFFVFIPIIIISSLVNILNT